MPFIKYDNAATMQGMLLNILGVDMIHDFCGGRGAPIITQKMSNYHVQNGGVGSEEITTDDIETSDDIESLKRPHTAVPMTGNNSKAEMHVMEGFEKYIEKNKEYIDFSHRQTWKNLLDELLEDHLNITTISILLGVLNIILSHDDKTCQNIPVFNSPNIVGSGEDSAVSIDTLPSDVSRPPTQPPMFHPGRELSCDDKMRKKQKNSRVMYTRSRYNKELAECESTKIFNSFTSNLKIKLNSKVQNEDGIWVNTYFGMNQEVVASILNDKLIATFKLPQNHNIKSILLNTCHSINKYAEEPIDSREEEVSSEIGQTDDTDQPRKRLAISPKGGAGAVLNDSVVNRFAVYLRVLAFKTCGLPCSGNYAEGFHTYGLAAPGFDVNITETHIMSGDYFGVNPGLTMLDVEKRLLSSSVCKPDTIEKCERKWIETLLKNATANSLGPHANEGLIGISKGNIEERILNLAQNNLVPPLVLPKTVIENAVWSLRGDIRDTTIKSYTSAFDSGNRTDGNPEEYGTYACGYMHSPPAAHGHPVTDAATTQLFYAINLDPRRTIAGIYAPDVPGKIQGIHTIYIKGRPDHSQCETYTMRYDDVGLNDTKSTPFERDNFNKSSLRHYLTAALTNLLENIPTSQLSWHHLYQRACNNNNNTDRTNFYSYALFKGLGDISQEMSVLMKNGGISASPHYSDESPVYNEGNALRIFVANDRPSANRFIFNCIKRPDGINIGAMGGYFYRWNYAKYFYTASPIGIDGSGSRSKSRRSNTRKYKQKNKKRNTKKNKKNKTRRRRR